MARKRRVEVEGGLYHVITRGNDRQDVFHTAAGHLKFLALLAKEKERSPFFLYAYCLMTKHLHLLIERGGATVGRIMQRINRCHVCGSAIFARYNLSIWAFA